MSEIETKTYSIKIPFLFDLCTISAGFYAGYNEGKGIATGNLENILLYGPTIVSVGLPLTFQKMSEYSRNFMSKRLINELENETLEITLPNGFTKKFKDLDDDEKDKFRPNITEYANSLEKNNNSYLPVIKLSTKTAIESTAGYFIGKLYSSIN